MKIARESVTVMHSRTAGNRIRISVIKGHKTVMNYKFEDIKLFRQAYVNVVATLKQAGYDVTYNEMVV